MSSRKKPLKNFLNSRWFFLLAVLLTVVVIFAFLQAFYRDYQIRQEIQSLQDEVKNLEAKKIETLDVLNYVKSDEYALEKARTELNLVYPGEKMMIINAGANKSGQENYNVIKSTNDDSNLKKWWRFFFNK